MDNQQILEQAIQKARANGWEFPPAPVTGEPESISGEWLAVGYRRFVSVYHIIFSHDFAKALWGKERIEIEVDYDLYYVIDDMRCYFAGEAWQYHLQQMVIADDPIKYLGEHIDG